MFAKELNAAVFLANDFIANMLSDITTAYKIQVYQYLIMRWPFFFHNLTCGLCGVFVH